MSTPTDSSKTIVFYDIAQRPPVEESACSPNPWKTRLALNFKRLPYTTSWVPLPDISKIRSNLKVPPCRKFADGTDFFTLPIIEDPFSKSSVGDSFDIAVHLEHQYPDSGDGNLFPALTLDYEYKHDLILVPLSEWCDKEFPEYAKFNMNVDAMFSMHSQLSVEGMPLDPATADLTKAEFVRRAGMTRWEEFFLDDQAREKMLVSFRDALGSLGKLFQKDASGPFILGKQACYADFIVGGWLQMMRVAMPAGEWEQLRGWHDGTFGRLQDGLEPYMTMS